MVLNVGFKENEIKVAAVDSNQKLLTCGEKLDHMFSSGYEFEALVAQAALVEALLGMYLRAKVKLGEMEIPEISSRATFGQLKDIAVKHSIIPDASIVEALVQYVDYRNDLAHNLILRFLSIDLPVAFNKGNQLIDFFHAYMAENPNVLPTQ